MKEKTKQLKAEISKGLGAVAEIGGLVEKKSIRKKIAALADDLRKLLKKDAKKKEKEAAKAEKKQEKAKKKPEKKAKPGKKAKPESKPVVAPAPPKEAKPQSGKTAARSPKKAQPRAVKAPKPADTPAEPATNLKAEVWKASPEE